jgi:hypothetical protein
MSACARQSLRLRTWSTLNNNALALRLAIELFYWADHGDESQPNEVLELFVIGF